MNQKPTLTTLGFSEMSAQNTMTLSKLLVEISGVLENAEKAAHAVLNAGGDYGDELSDADLRGMLRESRDAAREVLKLVRPIAFTEKHLSLLKSFVLSPRWSSELVFKSELGDLIAFRLVAKVLVDNFDIKFVITEAGLKKLYDHFKVQTVAQLRFMLNAETTT